MVGAACGILKITVTGSTGISLGFATKVGKAYADVNELLAQIRELFQVTR